MQHQNILKYFNKCNITLLLLAFDTKLSKSDNFSRSKHRELIDIVKKWQDYFDVCE